MIPNLINPPTNTETDAVSKVNNQPKRWTRIGTIAVEVRTPRFPIIFITPAAAPESRPYTSMTVDQNAPSVDSRNPTLNESPVTAETGPRSRAPHRRRREESPNPQRATARRPHRRPSRFTSKSQMAPPEGVITVDTTNGRLVKNPLRRRPKPRTSTRYV